MPRMLLDHGSPTPLLPGSAAAPRSSSPRVPFRGRRRAPPAGVAAARGGSAVAATGKFPQRRRRATFRARRRERRCRRSPRQDGQKTVFLLAMPKRWPYIERDSRKKIFRASNEKGGENK